MKKEEIDGDGFDDAFDDAFDEATIEDTADIGGDGDDSTTDADVTAGGDSDDAGDSSDTDNTDSAGDSGSDSDTDPEDKWADSSPYQRSEYQRMVQENARLAHQLKSDQGRVGALQRKLNTVQQGTSGSSTAGPTAKDVTEAMKSPESWATFKSEYPDIHDAIESRMVMERSQTQQQIDQALKPFEDDRAKQHQDVQDAALESLHPNWKETVRGGEFANWLEQQPGATKQLAKSSAAHDAAALISYYKQAKGIQASDPEGTSGSTTVTNIQKKRQRQLAASTGIQSRSNGKPDVAPKDDFDAAFDVFASR